MLGTTILFYIITCHHFSSCKDASCKVYGWIIGRIPWYKKKN